VTIPLIVGFAADPVEKSKTAIKGRQSGRASVAILRGHVTNRAGAPLAAVRVRVAVPAAEMRFVNWSTGHKLLETKTNAKGDYRLAEKQGWNRSEAVTEAIRGLLATKSGDRGLRSHP
jgi:hypothetical protein